MSRPDTKNAFDVAMATQLWSTIESADADPAVRVVALTGEGDYFSGGADVSIFLNMAGMDRRDLAKVAHLYEPLRACKKPTIAIVQGHAVGMGVTMLPHFDLVYAADHVTFTTPFVRLGLVLRAHTLSRLIGMQRAKELIFRAAPLAASIACEWGLATRIFPAAELEAHALTIAKEIAENPPSSVADSKRLLELGVAKTIDEMTAAEEEVLETRYGSEDNVRAIMAIMERKNKR